MNKLKDKIYEDIEKYYNQRVWITRIKANLEKTLSMEVPMTIIREVLAELQLAKKNSKDLAKSIEDSKSIEKSDWWLENMVDKVWEEKKYDYIEETDHIVFYPDGKPYPILRTTVEAMHEKYVRDGEGITAKQMRYEFKLTNKVWMYIKSVMDLTKDTIPFDKVTLSKINSPEEMDRLAIEKAEKLTEAKMNRVYTNAIARIKEKKIKDISLAHNKEDRMIRNLEKVIKTYNPRDFNDVEIPKLKNNNSRDVFITDAHLGKKWTDSIVIRFKKLTRDLLECQEKNINITFWWDLWELFIPYGEMHPWQKLGMENITTEELIMLIIDVFEQMLLELYKAGKIVTFNGMWGNHDRFTEKKEFDPYRTPAMVIYRFLERIVKDTSIKINILRDKANIIRSGKIKYVFLHGDGLSEKELTRRALAEMEDGIYLIIVSWDKHHYKMTEISDKILRVQSPALAWQGKYDKSLWMSSLPWALEFINNPDWLVDIIIRRYK